MLSSTSSLSLPARFHEIHNLPGAKQWRLSFNGSCAADIGLFSIIVPIPPPARRDTVKWKPGIGTDGTDAPVDQSLCNPVRKTCTCRRARSAKSRFDLPTLQPLLPQGLAQAPRLPGRVHAQQDSPARPCPQLAHGIAGRTALEGCRSIS